MISIRAPPPTSSFAHDSVAKHLALAESLGSTTSSSDIALIASFGEELRAFRRCEHTRSRHVCVLTQCARCSPFPSCNIFYMLHICMRVCKMKPTPSCPSPIPTRPVPLLRPASTRTMGSSLRASESARHASYTASALRGGRSGRVIRAAPVRSGDLQKRKSGSLARAAGRAGPRVLYPLGTHQSSLHPRYPEIYCAVLDDAARARLLELMQPGTLIMQSKERANESD